MHDYFGARFAGYKELGWPELGKVFDDPQITAEGAGGLADLWVHIHKQPMLVQMPDHSLVGTDKWMLVREPTHDDPHHRPLAVVSPSYNYLQNLEVARLLDSTLTFKFPVETAGLLDSGRTIFFLLRAGSAEIAGDHCVKYLLVTDRRDGGTALKIANVVVRVVCRNTLAAALDSALATFRIHHTATHTAMVDDRLQILHRLEGSMTNTLQRLEALTHLPLSEEMIERVVKAAFPAPKPKSKVDVAAELNKLGVDLASFTTMDFESSEDRTASEAERAQVFQLATKLNYQKFNDEYPAAAGTGWALYNALAEFCDFREGGSDHEAAKSALFGYRAQEKNRALKELELILAGSN